MYFKNVYFFTGNAYSGKSTLVKLLAERHGGVALCENYHNELVPGLDKKEFPNLTYTRDLKDWSEFIRRTPDEYEAWVRGVSAECERLELQLLKEKARGDKPVFADTNISLKMLGEIADRRHTLVMLAPPETAVERFFDRDDEDKAFLLKLINAEPDPEKAMRNFKACLGRINSREAYGEFLLSGFQVLLRDDQRRAVETAEVAEKLLGLA